MIGRTLGHYRVVDKIGAGGMGEVYRARDAKLGREVAIKVLPETFARDSERLRRFEQEARLLASVNHPHIAGIHGLEEFDGQRFLALELVPGQTLAEHLTTGPLPVEEALRLCFQIAEAVEAAHEKGVIHRDLKPSNIKVTPEGKVKVLDFGLAKAFGPEAADSSLLNSPTATHHMSREGLILGTAAYMSPEQARGKPLDKRTDIWSFGCVLYECLTGKQAFHGETVSDTLAAILKTEPDWSALPAETPPLVRAVLRRCLQKDPARRLHDIADARLELEEALATPAAAEPATLPGQSAGTLRRTVPWPLLGVVVLLAAAVGGGTIWLLRPAAEPQSPMHFAVPLLPSEPLALEAYPTVAISPAGAHVAYVVQAGGGRSQIYLRPMDRMEATPLAGTEGASSPFFSPDGQWVGFFADGKLKKVSITGGTPLTLCDAPDNRGAAWAPDDTIILSPHFTTGLLQISAAGGAPQPLTTPDSSKKERTHRWPDVLPGGRAVLFTLGYSDSPDNFDAASIAALSLETGKWHTLIESGSGGRYVPTGHLVYARGSTLLAAPFDPERLQLTGPPVPVLEGVQNQTTSGAAQYSFSRSGTLVYVPGAATKPDRALVWVDRSGTGQPIAEPRRAFAEPKLSPDGRKLALTLQVPNLDIWIYDLLRGTLTRFTFQGSNESPVWTPDGKRLTFVAHRGGKNYILWKPADGSGPEEELWASENAIYPSSWSPDGKFLIFEEHDPDTRSDLWMLPLEGDRKPRPVLRTPFGEFWGQVSPDGRWLAYHSNESGRDEVYVRPYPGPGGKWQISTEGGSNPLWVANGRELFYRNGYKMMAVPVQTGSTFSAGKPRLLFEERRYLTNFHYDVAPDGQRFAMIDFGDEERPPTQINVVLNWFEELKNRIPASNK